MNNKKIKTAKNIKNSLMFNLKNYTNRFEDGIVFTLYSDEFNLLEVGFAENDEILENKISSNSLILLDKKKGKKKELTLLINTLNELGIKNSNQLNFKYSASLMRHLSILGWPVGRSLYKQRKIKKELLCA